MTETYVPYSQRHGVTDPFLAKLVDHLERVIGWDIESVNAHNGYTSINSDKYHIYLYEGVAALTVDGRVKFEMGIKVFEQEYASLLSHYKI